MAKPVTGWIGYNEDTDRPTAKISTGEVDLAVAGSPGAHASTHQNGGSDEISVAGLSGQLADGQRASALITAGADVVVSAAAAPSAGQVLTATSSTAAAWETPSGDTGSNYWGTPATADDDDVEFDSATLPADYILWDLSGATAAQVSPSSGINIFTSPAAGACRIEANKARRRSWVLFQADAANRFWFYGRQYTIPANGFSVRTRLMTTIAFGGGSNNAGYCGLVVIKDDTDKPQVDGVGFIGNSIQMAFEPDAGALNIEVLTRVLPAANVSHAVTGDFDSFDPLDVEFELVQHMDSGSNSIWHPIIRGNSLVCVAPSGSINLGSSSDFEPGSVVWIGWLFAGITAMTPLGSPISGADYLRFGDVNFLP